MIYHEPSSKSLLWNVLHSRFLWTVSEKCVSLQQLFYCVINYPLASLPLIFAVKHSVHADHLPGMDPDLYTCTLRNWLPGSHLTFRHFLHSLSESFSTIKYTSQKQFMQQKLCGPEEQRTSYHRTKNV